MGSEGSQEYGSGIQRSCSGPEVVLRGPVGSYGADKYVTTSGREISGLYWMVEYLPTMKLVSSTGVKGMRASRP